MHVRYLVSQLTIFGRRAYTLELIRQRLDQINHGVAFLLVVGPDSHSYTASAREQLPGI